MQNTKERKRVYRVISWVLTVVMVIATFNLSGIPAGKVYAATYDAAVDFNQQGFEDEQTVTSVSVDGLSVSFAVGSNQARLSPKYYYADAAVRCYGGNTITVSSESAISEIDLSCYSGDDGNAISADVGTMTGDSWSGNANSVTFSIGGTGGHRSLRSIGVLYAEPIALDDNNTSLLVDEFTYTGAAIEPVVQYKASAEADAITLTKGTDYDVVQGGTDSATDADAYEFTIQGKGAYTGEVELDWVINPADVSSDKVMLDATKFFYTGETITPAVQYKGIEEAEAITLTKGTDYDVVEGGTDSATDIDTYAFKITGKGNFTGEGTFAWKIVPEKPMAKEGLEYDGTAQELIIPADSGDTYEYRYRIGNSGSFTTTVPTRTNAGSYVVNYRYYTRSSATSTNWNEDRSKRGNVTVEIAKFPVIVSPDADQKKTYGMSDSEFTYTVAPNGENKVLPEADFENGMFKNGSLTHTGGEAVGAHEFSITNLASSNSNYLVTMEENAPKFTITKKSLKDEDIVAVNYDENGQPIDEDGDGIFEYTYTGTVIEPDVQLYYSGREVNANGSKPTYSFDPTRRRSSRRNNDYKITEDDYALSGTTSAKDVSEEPYEISYRGKGNYTDTTSVKWEITEGEFDCEFIAYEGMYDGDSHESIVERQFFVDGEETDMFDDIFTAQYIIMTEEEYEEYEDAEMTDEEIWELKSEEATEEVPEVKDAGVYAIAYKVSVPSYEDFYGVNCATIDKAPVELSADEVSKVYDKDETTDPEITFTYDDTYVVEGDDFEDDIVATRAEGQDATVYKISFNIDELNDKYSNYDFTVADDSGYFVIEGRPVTISVPSFEKTYTDPIPEDYEPVIQPAGEVEGEGLLEGDDLNAVIIATNKKGETEFVGRDTDAGVYDLSVSENFGNTNYIITVDEENCGTLTVYPKDIEEYSEDDGTIAILYNGHEDKDNPVFAYTGETIEPMIMLTDFVEDHNYMSNGEEQSGKAGKYDYRITGEKKAEDIGVYYVEVQGINNYKGSLYLTWAILPFDFKTETIYNGELQSPDFVDGIVPDPNLFTIKYLNPQTGEYTLEDIPAFKDVNYDEDGEIAPYEIGYQVTLNPEEYGYDEEDKPKTFEGEVDFIINPAELALDLSLLTVTKEYDGTCEIDLDDPETGYAFKDYQTGIVAEAVNVSGLQGTLADPDSNHALGLSEYETDKRNVKLTSDQLDMIELEAANEVTNVDNYVVVFDEQADNACAIVTPKIIEGLDDLEALEDKQYDGTDDASAMVEPTCDTGIEGEEITLNVLSARYEEVIVEGDEFDVIDGKDVYVDEDGNPAPHDVSVFMLPEAANDDTKLANYARKITFDFDDDMIQVPSPEPEPDDEWSIITYLDEYDASNPMVAETTGTIVPRELEVVVDDIEKAYDGKAVKTSDVTFDVNGYQEIEDETAAYIDENLDKLFKFEFSAEAKNAGTYKIKASIADKEFEEILAEDNNYELADGNEAKIVITPKPVTVKVQDATKVEGEADPTFKYTVDGVVDGESLKNVKVTRKAGEAAGTYDVDVTCDADPNYEITFVGGKLTITAPASDYKNEWVDGQWYDADGKTDYAPKGSWKQNATGWWYEDESGWYPVSCWQKIDGLWYYFKHDGYMAASEWINGWWCDADGSCTYEGVGSWQQDSTGWWYGDTLGWYAVSSWQKIDSVWYYFGADGYMATSQYIDGYWVNEDGAWAE